MARERDDDAGLDGARYAAIEIDDGSQLIIFDRENHNAWIQSTVGVSMPYQ